MGRYQRFLLALTGVKTDQGPFFGLVVRGTGCWRQLKIDWKISHEDPSAALARGEFAGEELCNRLTRDGKTPRALSALIGMKTDQGPFFGRGARTDHDLDLALKCLLTLAHAIPAHALCRRVGGEQPVPVRAFARNVEGVPGPPLAFLDVGSSDQPGGGQVGGRLATKLSLKGDGADLDAHGGMTITPVKSKCCRKV